MGFGRSGLAGLQLALVVGLGAADGLERDVFLAKGARYVILEPILYAVLVKIMLEVARKRHH